jgi:hypothetical protein
MKSKPIERYLARLKLYLCCLGLADPRALEELEGHLYESLAAGLERGQDLETAQAQALEKFGPAWRVAIQFEREKMNLAQILLLAAAVAGGIFCAYVDALPKFDDTGILAFAILIFSGLLGLPGARRPGLLALAVGLWIPLRDIPNTGNFGALLALLFAAAGAYSGWALNRLIRKTWRAARV